MSMVGQSESDDIFVSELKSKEHTNYIISLTFSIPMGK